MCVHVEQPRGRSANIGSARDDTRSYCKVSSPRVDSGIEKSHDTSGCRVDRGQICAFECVATIAGERQVDRIVRPAVLFRDNVFNVETRNDYRLMDAAILTAIRGAAADQSLSFCVHRINVTARFTRWRVQVAALSRSFRAFA